MTRPDPLLASLLEGNRRHVEGGPRRGLAPERRRELAAGQSPRVAVLGCADSRVDPERVFDLMPGEVFTVRAAGHPACRETIGSLEYAVLELGVELIVVLGHSGCGAVTAARQPASGEPTNLACLVDAVRRHVAGCGSLEEAIRANVVGVVGELAAESETIEGAVAEAKLRVVGALYDLSSGVVELV